MKKTIVRFQSPFIAQAEINAAISALKNKYICGNGPVTKRLEAMIAKITGSPYVFFTNSCTSALELAVMASGIKSADEVICPSFSFVSAANAIVRQQARPVFVEIDKQTFNMDIDSFKKAITRRTKAVILTHYGGSACPMEEIMQIAKRHNLIVIEDAAQAIGSFYNGKHLGTIGDFGCISFHSTKNATCGEGGALLTNNKIFAGRIEYMREKGTNRTKFLQGAVDKYTWLSVGSSYVQSDILAAILIVQLKRLPETLRKHYLIADYYNKNLESVSDIIQLPRHADCSRTNWHIYAVLIEPKKRKWFMASLRRKGIETAFHFVPLHSSPFARRFGYRRGDFPVTEYVSEAIVRLPIYYKMKIADATYVTSAVKDILNEIF